MTSRIHPICRALSAYFRSGHGILPDQCHERSDENGKNYISLDWLGAPVAVYRILNNGRLQRWPKEIGEAA